MRVPIDGAVLIGCFDVISNGSVQLFWHIYRQQINWIVNTIFHVWKWRNEREKPTQFIFICPLPMLLLLLRLENMMAVNANQPFSIANSNALTVLAFERTGRKAYNWSNFFHILNFRLKCVFWLDLCALSLPWMANISKADLSSGKSLSIPITVHLFGFFFFFIRVAAVLSCHIYFS